MDQTNLDLGSSRHLNWADNAWHMVRMPADSALHLARILARSIWVQWLRKWLEGAWRVYWS